MEEEGEGGRKQPQLPPPPQYFLHVVPSICKRGESVRVYWISLAPKPQERNLIEHICFVNTLTDKIEAFETLEEEGSAPREEEGNKCRQGSIDIKTKTSGVFEVRLLLLCEKDKEDLLSSKAVATAVVQVTNQQPSPELKYRLVSQVVKTTVPHSRASMSVSVKEHMWSQQIRVRWTLNNKTPYPSSYMGIYSLSQPATSYSGYNVSTGSCVNAEYILDTTLPAGEYELRWFEGADRYLGAKSEQLQVGRGASKLPIFVQAPFVWSPGDMIVAQCELHKEALRDMQDAQARKQRKGKAVLDEQTFLKRLLPLSSSDWVAVFPYETFAHRMASSNSASYLWWGQAPGTLPCKVDLSLCTTGSSVRAKRCVLRYILGTSEGYTTLGQSEPFYCMSNPPLLPTLEKSTRGMTGMGEERVSLRELVAAEGGSGFVDEQHRPSKEELMERRKLLKDWRHSDVVDIDPLEYEMEPMSRNAEPLQSLKEICMICLENTLVEEDFQHLPEELAHEFFLRLDLQGTMTDTILAKLLQRLAQTRGSGMSLQVCDSRLVTGSAFESLDSTKCRFNAANIRNHGGLGTMVDPFLVHFGSSLRILSLSANVRAKKSCLPLIAEHCALLEELDLSHCLQFKTGKIREAVLSFFGTSQQPNPTRNLRVLKLADTRIKDFFFRDMRSSTLTHLDVSECSLLHADESVLPIIEGFPRLEILDLSSMEGETIYNNAGSCKPLSLPHLRILFMRNCVFGVSLLEILDAVRIEQLAVDPMASPSGVEKLICRYSSSIISVDLSGSAKLEDRQIVEIVDTCNSLIRLDIRGCEGLSEEVVENISRKLLGRSPDGYLLKPDWGSLLMVSASNVTVGELFQVKWDLMRVPEPYSCSLHIHSLAECPDQPGKWALGQGLLRYVCPTKTGTWMVGLDEEGYYRCVLVRSSGERILSPPIRCHPVRESWLHVNVPASFSAQEYGDIMVSWSLSIPTRTSDWIALCAPQMDSSRDYYDISYEYNLQGQSGSLGFPTPAPGTYHFRYLRGNNSIILRSVSFTVIP